MDQIENNLRNLRISKRDYTTEPMTSTNFMHTLNVYNENPTKTTVQEKIGEIQSSTVKVFPTEKLPQRVIEFSSNGTLNPNYEEYFFVYDFSMSNLKFKVKNEISGTLNIGGQTFHAQTLLKSIPSRNSSLLVFRLTKQALHINLTQNTIFRFQFKLIQNELILNIQTKSSLPLQVAYGIFRIYTSKLIYIDSEPPELTVDEGEGSSTISYTYKKGDTDIYSVGQAGLGYDMLATYYTIEAGEKEPVFSNLQINISKISYWSLNYTIPGETQPGPWYWINSYKLENEHFKADYLNFPDPFVPGNASTGCYELSDDTSNCTNSCQFTNELFSNRNLSDVAISHSDELQIYRPDVETSESGLVPDCYDWGTCLDTYLVTPVKSDVYPLYPEYDYATVKIKVPKTYDGSKCQKSQTVDTLYFSVTSTFPSLDEAPKNPLPYWSINAVQLDSIKDDDGYAYIYFGKYESVYDYLLSMRKEDTSDPVTVTRGGKIGFLMGNATFLYICRYRASNPEWEGNPDNATCYRNRLFNQPLSTDSLGSWTPQIIGENFDSFKSFLDSPPPM